MADNKDELVFEGMPGADAKTEEDVQPFQVDMNFENTEEEVEEAQEFARASPDIHVQDRIWPHLLSNYKL